MKERLTNTAFVLTGGNLGNRLKQLTKAKELIEARCGRITAESAIYETAAWGNTAQPAFLNQALRVETSLLPVDLMKKLLEAELDLGRQRFEKYGPRIIDMDILFYNDVIMEHEQLILPHPQLHLRRFALVALNDIAPEHVHPVQNETVAQLLYKCADPLNVQKF